MLTQVSSSVVEILAQKGRGFLQTRMKGFHEKKSDIYQNPGTKIKQAIILAAGTHKDFKKPAGLMSLDANTLLKRNIDILMEALNITLEDIQEISSLGGMTNKNFKVLISGKEYVLRIPGNGTEQMINRKEEKVNSSLASEVGIDTDLVYFNEETGVKITEFIQNAETLNPKTVKRHDYMKLTTAILRDLHYSNIKMANRFNVFEKINDYERLMKEVNGQPYKGYEEVRAQVLALKEIFQEMNITLTPCHNDLVAENFVKSGNGKVYLIDWEYSGMNDPMWDVAAHSLECDFSPEEEGLFLSLYLEQEGQIPLEIEQRVLMNKIFQDFLWSIWTIIKEAKGDDFGTYGIDRLNRAGKNLDNILLKELKCYEYEK